MFGVLSGMKLLRGTPFDLFGYTAERKMERALISEYETTMGEISAGINDNTRDLAIALAELPLEIRGFGYVKADNVAKAAKKREELLAAFRSGGTSQSQAAE